jgi:uncharacterized protein
MEGNAAMDVAASPVSARERIGTLDAIRGFALLGIFIMNLPAFHEPIFEGVTGAPTYEFWWDRAAATVQDVLFSGKFNGMFSMLFAVGFTIQLQRLRERDAQHATGIYLRRVIWLLIFGLIHACVFWNGDVLHMYALFGLLLVFVLNRLPDKTIIGLTALLLMYPVISNTLLATFTDTASLERAVNGMKALNAAQDAANGHGSFWEAVRQNIETQWLLYTGPWKWRLIPGWYATLGVTMLIGLLLGRHRIFQNAAQHLPVIKRVQYASLIVGIAGGAVYSIWKANTANPLEPSLLKAVAGLSYAISRVSVMTFYVATIVRAMHSDIWQRLLQPIVATGRMPLTNYLLQTLIGTFVFSGWGLGYWRVPGPAFDLVFAIGVFFLIQAPLSVLWLRHFERGPMEHLWRKLTYWSAWRSSGLVTANADKAAR